MESLGVKEIRRMRGISQEAMVEALGIHAQTYRKLESSPDKMAIKQVKQVCDVLNTPFDVLYFRELTVYNK